MYRNHAEAQAARARRRRSRVPGAADLDNKVFHEMRKWCDSRVETYRTASGQFGIEAGDIAFIIFGAQDFGGHKIAGSLKRLKARGLVYYDDVYHTWTVIPRRPKLAIVSGKPA